MLHYGVSDGRVEFSVSTWRQPVPLVASPERAAVVDQVAHRVLALGQQRPRVVVDGLTAAGKTSFGHELAQRLAAAGRVVLRASLDDFKRPWNESHLYDRVSGEGYYRNAFDYDAVRRLLLGPAGAAGSGRVALCSIDPLTQVDHSAVVVDMPAEGVLVVDGVFGLRPELDPCWDLRLWLQVDPALSVRRGVARDGVRAGGAAAAEALHRDRYLAAESLYLAEVDPIARADVVVDNTDFERPVLVRS